MATKTIEERLFEALDDCTRYIYHLYKTDSFEYPSEKAIMALVDAEAERIGISKALAEMIDDDIAEALRGELMR